MGLTILVYFVVTFIVMICVEKEDRHLAFLWPMIILGIAGLFMILGIVYFCTTDKPSEDYRANSNFPGVD